MAVQVSRSQQHHDRVVVLLEGALSELPLLSTASVAREMLELPAAACWIGRRDSAGRALLAEMVRPARFDELDIDELGVQLSRDRVRMVILSQEAWRRHAGRLWRRLRSSSVYVCRRGVTRLHRLLCCADTPQTADALLRRISEVLPLQALEVTVLHAEPPPPMWAQALSGIQGMTWPIPLEPAFGPIGPAVPSIVVGGTMVEAAVRRACAMLEPDVVVLGWHRHQVPLPDRWLHPTAWRLSTRLSQDVVLGALSTDGAGVA